MRFLRTASAVAALGLAAVGFGSVAAGPTAGGFTSADVEWLSYMPFDVGTATGLTIRGDHAFVTSWRAVSVYEISDPQNPTFVTTVPFGFRFENEDVTGNDELLFFSESLPGDALHIYDISDPSNPVEINSVAGAGDHTSQCVLNCEYVMGSDGSVTWVGQTPENAKNAEKIDMDWRQSVGLKGSNHDLELIQENLVMTTPISDDFQVLDVSDPLNPVVLGRGKHPDPSSWLFHSGEWFNDGTDRFIIQQGEQNFNPQCGEGNGPITLFEVTQSPIDADGNLAADAVERGNKATAKFQAAEGDKDLEAIAAADYPVQAELTDTYAVGNGVYADGSPAVNALGCSAHWFDNQPDFRDGGLIAAGYYEHGTRFLEVTSDARLLERGYFLPHAGSTSAAYWLDERTVWAVDYTRGIDILEWTGEIINGNGRLKPAK